MFIFNVLPLREFRSPKLQFAMVNVCVLSMYYHVLLMYFPQKREGSLTAKCPNLLAKIWYGLTILIRFLILNLQAKFFKFTLCLLAKDKVNYTFCAIHHHPPQKSHE